VNRPTDGHRTGATLDDGPHATAATAKRRSVRDTKLILGSDAF